MNENESCVYNIHVVVNVVEIAVIVVRKDRRRKAVDVAFCIKVAEPYWIKCQSFMLTMMRTKY
jgi:hypothetical protein